MNMSIKFKLLILVAGIGIVLSLILAVYSPIKSTQLAEQVMKNDAEFIVRLLADNISLGMQTMMIDDGAALQSALDLLKKGDKSTSNEISSVRVFDNELKFVKGVNESKRGGEPIIKVNKLEIKSIGENTFRATQPIRDASKNILGYLEVDFSKTFLRNSVWSHQVNMIGIAIAIFALSILIGFIVVNKISKALVTFIKGAKKVSEGDINVEFKRNSNDEIGQLAASLSMMVNRFQNIINEINSLAAEASNGNLSYRGKADNFQGAYFEVISGVNNILESVVAPLKISGKYVTELSTGMVPDLIEEDFKGDFNEIRTSLNSLIKSTQEQAFAAKAIAEGDLNVVVNIRSEDDILSKSLASVINVLKGLTEELRTINEYALEGNLAFRGNQQRFSGAYSEIIRGTNEILDSILKPVNEGIHVLTMVSEGIINEKIDADYKGDYEKMKTAINNIIYVLRNLYGELTKVSASASNGDLKARCSVDGFENSYADILKGVNQMLDAILIPIDEANNVLVLVSEGKTDEIITKTYHGDHEKMKIAVNKVALSIRRLIEDGEKLSHAAIEGNLSYRNDVSRHNGDFKKVISGINQTLDTLTAPVNEAVSVLEVMSTGDLTARMEGDYSGENQKLKESINSVAENLSELIFEVSRAVETVAYSAEEITNKTESIATAAQEQSSQVIQVATAIEEMTRTVSENADNSGKTSEVARKYGDVATDGGHIVKQTVIKMNDIAQNFKKSASNIEKLGDSSKQIGEIISVINDIADQTNLLALNAAIEAARAGEQGRGFAVVADEVRKLAERTTDATKQIAAMISGIQNETQNAVNAMQKGNDEVTQGISFADKAGLALDTVVTSSKDVVQMINAIALATGDQLTTSEQIAQNIDSISTVTNETAKNIQDIAHSSEELKSLTENLRDVMMRFTVEDLDVKRQMSYRLADGGKNRLNPKRN